jgi:hypothetical protein
MPPLEAGVNLNVRVLLPNGDPAFFPDVVSIQLMLAVLQAGWRPWERGLQASDHITGVYDSATEQAVKKFQRHAGLTQTGTVGEKTWTALLDEWISMPVWPNPDDENQSTESESAAM